ncbi:MAG: hypothetical protein WEA09_07190 [Gemmatimonadota bacterium]
MDETDGQGGAPSSPADNATGFPDDAFISPEDPLIRTSGTVDEALISPDDPIRKREPRHPEDEGVATGIGDDGPVYGATPAARHQRAVDAKDMAVVLERLASGLRERGAASLLVSPTTPRFEAMLQGFLAGYLVGRGDNRRE